MAHHRPGGFPAAQGAQFHAELQESLQTAGVHVVFPEQHVLQPENQTDTQHIAVALKEEGNEAVKLGKWELAVEKYGAAIKLYDSGVVKPGRAAGTAEEIALKHAQVGMKVGSRLGEGREAR